MQKMRLIIAVLVLLFSMMTVMGQDGTVVEVVAGNENFSTLASLVEAAGLGETLGGEGPFTVFAPNNAAFEALSPAVTDYLMANPDLLTAILNYHVVDGGMMAADVATGEVATMDMGHAVDVAVDDMGVHVNNAAVVTADMAASNGVVHEVDTVLLPEFTLPEVDPLSVSGNVVSAGSSTVFPLAERMADLFSADGFPDTITVDSVGTGAGFERFCVNAETDISNASRPIREEE
ncbi:MAG: fasciclin domain-containing protein, partial [Chloroflexi bacterium]|nr:fasciclin domain-containing protein [Chloroflexota bacterium]